MFCIKCGNEIPDGAHFCPNCGTSVISEPLKETQVLKEKKRSTISIGIIVFSAILSALSVISSIILFVGPYWIVEQTRPYVFASCIFSLLIVVGCILLKRSPAFITILGCIIAVFDLSTMFYFLRFELGISFDFRQSLYFPFHRGSFLLGLNVIQYWIPVTFVILAIGVFARGNVSKVCLILSVILFIISSIIVAIQTVSAIEAIGGVFYGLAKNWLTSQRWPLYVRVLWYLCYAVVALGVFLSTLKDRKAAVVTYVDNPAGGVNQDTSRSLSDAPSGGYAVLCFFFPVVGLILYLVWKDQFPMRAKSCGKGALVGVIVYVASIIILYIIQFTLIFSMFR